MMKKMILSLTILLSSAASGEEIAPWYNPNPIDEDVILPMPCDGYKIVFRKIYTKFSDENPKLMSDVAYNAGTNSQDNKSPFSQTFNKRYIQGGFQDEKGMFYYLAKYELMQAQYDAVMQPEKCKPQVSKKETFPVVNVSWFDAVDFSRKYSKFLQQSKDPSVPIDNGNIAFARLPSGNEWEFAARGGRSVSEAEFSADIPLIDGESDLNKYAWYQGSKSSNGKIQLPGRKSPNALGLFDMLGNVSEMLFEPFQATRTGRLHGLQGGFTVRGGSFMTPSELMASYTRTERDYYTKGQETKAKDMGFRIALASPVAATLDELKIINAEISELGTDSSSGMADAGKNHSMKMVDDLSKSKAANDNKELKKDIESLKMEMIKTNSERDEMRSAAIVSNIRLGGFLCRALSDELSTYNYFSSLAGKLKQRCDQGATQFCENYEKQKVVVERFKNNLDYLSRYYGDNIVYAISTYERFLLDEQVNTAKKSGGDNSIMPNFIDAYLDHLNKYKLKEKNLSEQQQMWINDCNSIVK